jgi:hypothetical protein
MKKVILAVFIITAFMLNSCKKDSVDASKLSTVGTTWSSGTGNSSITVTESGSGGEVLVSAVYDGKAYAAAGKMTTEGMSDYFYSGGDKSKEFTLVKFDANVGDKYTFNVGNLQVVRTVISKSTTDDEYVPALGFYIKGIKVREDVPQGITIDGKPTTTKTITWSINHKFGIYYAEVVTTDGVTHSFPLNSTNAGQ